MTDPWQRCLSHVPNEQEFIEHLQGPFRRAFRLHPKRGSLSSAWQDTEPVPWAQRGYFHAAHEDPAAYLDYHTGTIYPQDAASQLPVTVLNAQPGEIILDACAAPGSKTTAIALDLSDAGCVIASDAAPQRRRIIRENVSRQGLINVAVTPCSIEELADLGIQCDAALTDVPCSGHEQRSKKQVQKLARKQLKILEQAARCVRSGGRLVYSTCTMYFEENEDVIDAFINKHQEWTIKRLEMPGLQTTEQGSLRLWPDRERSEPFFCALLVKDGNLGSRIPQQYKPAIRPVLPCRLPDVLYCTEHKQFAIISNELVASLDIPLQSRGILLAELESGDNWRLNNWAVQALIERGHDADVVSYADALALWSGESLGSVETMRFLKTERGAPLGMSRAKELRLNLSSRAFRSVL